MKYFKGSQRKVRKSTSPLAACSSHGVARETEDASTSEQTAELPKKNKTPKKRSRDSQKTEGDDNVTSRSRKRKAPPSENKIGHKTSKSAVIGRKNKSKRKELETKQDESTSSMETTDERINQPLVDHSEDLSACELDGNVNLSDNGDSTFLHDADVQQSDRDFLQQQIRVLKTPFELEVDCTALAKIRANDPKHIPLEVIQRALKKVNHKNEDELMRSFNRTAQRKILSRLQQTKPEQTDSKSNMLNEQLQASFHDIKGRVADLEKLHNDVKQKHFEHKNVGILVSQLEAASEEFNSKKLMEEIKRTNTVNKVVNAGLSLSDAPVTHQQLVEILFKD